MSLTYSNKIFIDNNTKRIKKLPIKTKAISFDAIIDLDDNVLLFNINDHIDLNSFKKILYTKGIKIRSF